MEAYTPLSDVQCLVGVLTDGTKTHIRRLSRPSSRTSWVVATYANAPRARARAVSVIGLKKNLKGGYCQGFGQCPKRQKAYSTLVSIVSWKGSILV